MEGMQGEDTGVVLEAMEEGATEVRQGATEVRQEATEVRQEATVVVVTLHL